MNKFSIELAQEADDDMLQRVLAQNDLEGDIRISFQTKPSFFSAIQVHGKDNQVIIARSKVDGTIAGFGVRSIRTAYVNGTPIDIGYLNSLRLTKDQRRGNLVARGFKFFKQLDDDKKVPFYLMVLIEDNIGAKEILTRQRFGIPICKDFGKYYTYVISAAHKKKRRQEGAQLDILRGSQRLIAEIMECLARNGKEKQFYPYVTKEEFDSDCLGWRDLKIENFYVAQKAGRIVGVLACWDQNNFRRVLISDYCGVYKIGRPFYNIWARLYGYPLLPQPGSYLQGSYVSLIAIDNNDKDIFRELLNKLLVDTLVHQCPQVFLGLHERDPLREIIDEYRYFHYCSRLYLAYSKERGPELHFFDNRVPYLDIGTL